MKKIVWGTCWYNEDVETIIDFFIETEKILKTMNVTYSFVVFDAKFERDSRELEKLRAILNCTVIQNRINCFPNKNYGVYTLTNIAHIKKSDLVAIVDSDWKIENFVDFVKGLLKPIVVGEYDVVIPDITAFAGRSNFLLGVPMIQLFYPEISFVKTPFPGAVAAITDKLKRIVDSENYHFDWGGEWDIISEAVKNNLKISSPALGMRNVRHRSSFSKTSDSFQIWRALFQGADYERICNSLKAKDNIKIKQKYRDLENILKSSATNQIVKFDEYRKKENVSSTISQIMCMELLPLAFLLDGNDLSEKIMLSQSDNQEPYNRDEIADVAYVAMYSIIEAISNSELPLENISYRIKELSGGFMGDWSNETITQSKEEFLKIVGEVDVRWN